MNTGARMRKFLIERAIPAIGRAESSELAAVSRQSNRVLRHYRPNVQWIQSYVAADKTFCIYVAANEEILREYAAKSGFPADKITEIKTVIDPSTANQ